MYICVYICVYIYISLSLYIYIYIYVRMWQEQLALLDRSVTGGHTAEKRPAPLLSEMIIAQLVFLLL